MSKICLICGDLAPNVGDYALVGAKGLETLRKCSLTRGDEKWRGWIDVRKGIVHHSCRKNYTRERSVQAAKQKLEETDELQATRTRGTLPNYFDFKTCCLFCADNVSSSQEKQKRKKSSLEFSLVHTLKIKDTILNHCKIRNDKWASEVSLRISNVNDLVAAEGRYHRACYTRFLKPVSSSSVIGRPKDEHNEEAFHSLCMHIENNEETTQFSMSDLHDAMKSKLNSDEDEMWTQYYLRRRLEEHFGDNIIITDFQGKPSILCLKGNAKKLINDSWYLDRCTNEADEKIRIIKAAVALLQEDILSKAYDVEHFPSSEEMSNGGLTDIPESLLLFLEELVHTKSRRTFTPEVKRKLVTISNIVIKLIRPNSYMAPILHGLSVYLHRKFESRDVIDLLNNLGLCNSYSSALKFEDAAVSSKNVKVEENAFVQFIFDNVRTLDGKGTFHSLGGVMCITPKSSVIVEPRLRVMRERLDTHSKGFLEIKSFEGTKDGLSSIVLKPYANLLLMEPKISQDIRLLNTLFVTLHCLQNRTPAWQGFMESVFERHIDISISDVIPLPFVNDQPMRKNTVYTSLVYAVETAKNLSQKTCIVTFDQPLHLKAVDIVKSADQGGDINQIVVRLGGFHLLMSYMGAVGYLMSGSGIEDLWKLIYAENCIPHMLKGESYSRSLRAHFLTSQALLTILMENYDLNFLADQFKELSDHENLLNCLGENTAVINVHSYLWERLSKESEKSRTSMLWAEYLGQVELIKLYIVAERIGIWDLHLYVISKVLPVFHAAGHNNYAKSCHIYLQEMMELKDGMDPKEFKSFTDSGFFTIRRNEKVWSVTWSDMIIEQTLMRSMKVAGGLTHGRGITSSTVERWVASVPLCTKLIESVESFSGIFATSSHQHVELRDSRISRDRMDAAKLVDWLRIRNPLNLQSKSLFCLSTGLSATEEANCDQSLALGLKSLEKIENCEYRNASIKRSSRCKNMAYQFAAKVGKKKVDVNESILFHRIIALAKSLPDLQDCLRYELSRVPLSIFETDGSFRKANKANLLHFMESKCSSVMPATGLTGKTFVIDGGYLLRKVVWKKESTYQDICDQYGSYLRQNYGDNIIVVFDGYDHMSVKHFEQSRRGNVLTTESEGVRLDGRPPIAQYDFLKHNLNKANLLKLMIPYLQSEFSLKVLQARDDADVDIVKQAVQLASIASVVVIGEDTDILVLLLHYIDEDMDLAFLRPGKSTRNDKRTLDIYTNVQEIANSCESLKKTILVVHSFSGCDTTSGFFQKGKKFFMKVLEKSDYFIQECSVFYRESADKKELITSGEKILKAVYSVRSLDNARYQLYAQKIHRSELSSSFNIASLPPSPPAAANHFFRVYYQVQKWLGNDLDPTDWGWMHQFGHLVPNMGTADLAPNWVMKSIFCNCKKMCSGLCSCKRSGLRCAEGCKNCIGLPCTYNEQTLEEEETESVF